MSKRFYQEVSPVLLADAVVPSLCMQPYPNHPHGCPNFGKRDTCPPKAPRLGDIVDLSKSVYAIWNVFNLAEHVVRMYVRHPEWSARQLRCCLYWQGTARKALRENIAAFRTAHRECTRILLCPEACGVNVTATMKGIDISLEWPPQEFAYQVALAGEEKS